MTIQDQQARRIIFQEYGSSTNMMTPRRLEFGMIGEDQAYELSQGTGIEDEPLFGVSVARQLPDGSTERMGEPQSTCFRSVQLARRHIARLRAEL